MPERRFPPPWSGRPLRNVKHEQFVQLLLQGKDATDAHEQVGFQRDRGNAARLQRNPKVQSPTKCAIPKALGPGP
jgi:hypothetical protein